MSSFQRYPHVRRYCTETGARIVITPCATGGWYATAQTSPNDDGAPVFHSGDLHGALRKLDAEYSPTGTAG